MNLSNLHPAGFKHSDAFRVGRGHGSENGKTAGRGQKVRNLVLLYKGICHLQKPNEHAGTRFSGLSVPLPAVFPFPNHVHDLHEHPAVFGTCSRM